MKIKKIILFALGLIVAVNPFIVSADEAAVSGNGAGTSNTVTIEVNQSNTTTQNNTAEVTNNVDINANTGNNEASDNTGGETNISTGDVNSNVEIVNAGINQNYVDTGCCLEGVSAQITGNGSGSNNNINYSVNNSSNINVGNSANINNSISGSANTGYNKANNNTVSSVTITTGDIKVSDTIKNNSINLTNVSASAGTTGEVSLKIAGNGSDSVNSINLSDENNTNVNVVNSATINNLSSWDLNTGGNEANGNTGAEVKIATGDIEYTSTIENKDINVSYVDVDCCDEGDDDPDPEPPAPPKNPDNPCGNCSSSESKPGSGNGSTTSNGAILPVTGGPSLLLLGIMNVLMFFLGGYLRLRSGRSPAFAA